MVRELEGLKREIALFPDDASVWQTVPGVTNSAGNLALHVAGNLQYFIGGVLGGTGYVRNRELEFGRRSGTRAEIAAELDAAIRVVRDVLPGLSAGDASTRRFPSRDGPALPDRHVPAPPVRRTPRFISARPATCVA